MLDTNTILQKAADKAGLTRTRYEASNVPTLPSDVCLLPFFGDIRSLTILSALLLKRIKESKRYLALVSWPGCEHLFPYADEYWTPNDPPKYPIGFENDTPAVSVIHKALNYFLEVTTADDILKLYDNGLTPEFFKLYGDVKKFMPVILSASSLSPTVSRKLSQPGKKVMIWPVKHVRSWRKGKQCNIPASEKFWMELINKLCSQEITPLVYQGFDAHQLYNACHDKCVFLPDQDIGKLLAAMRSVDCVLDMFSDFWCLAAMARSPFIACAERGRRSAMKDWELDMIFNKNIPHEYIFSSSTIIDKGDPQGWGPSLLDLIMVKLDKFSPTADLPPAAECEETVIYEKLKEQKIKRFGTKYIRKAILWQ